MSIIDTLITNRTQADVDALRALYAKPKSMWTADEWNEFLLGNHRGAYNASDMNRVLDALDYLAERVTEFGYRKPEIKRPTITEVIPGTSKLPEGYTDLEYIRSTGEQYIDSKFIPTYQSRVVMDFEGVTLGSTFQTLFGVRSTASATDSKQFGVHATSSAVFRSDYFGTNKTLGTVNGSGRTTVDQNKNVATMGTVSVINTAVTSGVCSYTLPLFAMNNAGTIAHFCAFILYHCLIYDNDTLVRDYVPCLNPSNEVGLYDIVNGVFYGNAGTGEFIAGPESGNTPRQTIERDYYAIGDRPPESELRNYLDNVAAIRSVFELPSGTPELPEDISKRILIEEANNIEIILTAVELLLNRILLSWVYSGEFTAGEV